MDQADPPSTARPAGRLTKVTWTTATACGAVLVIGGAALAYPAPLAGAVVILLGLLLVLATPLLQHRHPPGETAPIWHALMVSVAIALLLGNLALLIQGHLHTMGSLPILLVSLALALRHQREER